MQSVIPRNSGPKAMVTDKEVAPYKATHTKISKFIDTKACDLFRKLIRKVLGIAKLVSHRHI